MRTYKPIYKDRQGAPCQTHAWYLELRIRGKVHRVPGFSDKGATLALGKKLERLAELRESGGREDAELSRWVENLEAPMRARLVRIGLLDNRRLAAARKLSEILDEWKAALGARGRTVKWIELVYQRARVTLDGCGFVSLSNIDAAAVERDLQARREGRIPAPERRGTRGRPPRASISTRESNHRLQACREFTRWAVERGLLNSDPLVSLKPLNARLDARHVRRALLPDELRTLVLAAAHGPTIRNVTGSTRALAWRLGCEAGLRIGEIVALQVRDLELDSAGGPILTVRATVSKNRTEARLPLHPGLAQDLRPYVQGKLALASVLALPASFRHRATYWLKCDLNSAGIPYEDGAGRKADVHSLRSSFITSLVRSGANVKAVQRLARHASPVETVGIYTRLSPEDERDALRALPSIAAQLEPKEGRATGTDGVVVLASCLPEDPAKEGDLVLSGANSNRTPGPENMVWGVRSGEDDGTRTRNHRIDSPVL